MQGGSESGVSESNMSKRLSESSPLSKVCLELAGKVHRGVSSCTTVRVDHCYSVCELCV